MVYKNLSVDDYNAMMAKIEKSYLPKDEKKKPKLSLKQIFFLKKKFNK